MVITLTQVDHFFVDLYVNFENDADDDDVDEGVTRCPFFLTTVNANGPAIPLNDLPPRQDDDGGVPGRSWHDEARRMAERAGHTAGAVAGGHTVGAAAVDDPPGQLRWSAGVTVAAREGDQHLHPVRLPVDLDEGDLVQR